MTISKEYCCVVSEQAREIEQEDRSKVTAEKPSTLWFACQSTRKSSQIKSISPLPSMMQTCYQESEPFLIRSSSISRIPYQSAPFRTAKSPPKPLSAVYLEWL